MSPHFSVRILSALPSGVQCATEVIEVPKDSRSSRFKDVKALEPHTFQVLCQDVLTLVVEATRLGEEELDHLGDHSMSLLRSAGRS